MYDLNDAELVVETRFSIESGNNDGEWFYLRDYGSLSEFFTDCASWFSNEKSPEYVYLHWENIPDCMISENWISPNIFTLRDALQAIEEPYLDVFFEWCKTYGWDIASDDPHKIVSEFEYAFGGIIHSDQSEYSTEGDEYSDSSYSDMRIGYDMFTDDYN